MSISGCPEHIGIIMDGNGRWAKKRALPRSAGHKKGAEAMEKLISFAETETDIKFLTFYAFSTENWSRPKEEVDYLMQLFETHLDRLLLTTEKHDVKLKFTGDRSLLSPNLVSKMEECERKTSSNSKLCVFIALNYGGRQEIATALKGISEKIKNGEIKSEEINEALISKEMSSFAPPDADLIIRPSGELRLSNFLLWQSAYAEFYFSNVLWPDFSDKDLIKAIDSFNKRDRRFGGV